MTKTPTPAAIAFAVRVARDLPASPAAYVADLRRLDHAYSTAAGAYVAARDAREAHPGGWDTPAPVAPEPPAGWVPPSQWGEQLMLAQERAARAWAILHSIPPAERAAEVRRAHKRLTSALALDWYLTEVESIALDHAEGDPALVARIHAARVARHRDPRHRHDDEAVAAKLAARAASRAAREARA